MKRIVIVLIGIVVAAVGCQGESPCVAAEVRPLIEAAPGPLTLADFIDGENCPALRRQAELVKLGAVPRHGGERVMEGNVIAGMVDELRDRASSRDEAGRVPERIVIRSQGSTKSCAEIANSVSPGLTAQTLDCASANGVPEDATLELMKTGWNAGLRRWEFVLRCVKPEDCVPFLVWSRGEAASSGGIGFVQTRFSEGPKAEILPARLVKRGQRAMLTWDRGGIRVVLAVTCLEAGGRGEVVRVQIPNVTGTVRAEVLADGTLRTAL